MADSILNCDPAGWLAIASAITILGLLALGAAALLKYLVTDNRHAAAG